MHYMPIIYKYDHRKSNQNLTNCPTTNVSVYFCLWITKQSKP